MRTFVKGLLKHRMLLWSLLALAVGGLSLAWVDQNQYRFGGAWWVAILVGVELPANSDRPGRAN